MRLERIVVFPIKGLDGIDLAEARITARGILENDRVFAIERGDGKFVNGKREPRIFKLRCSFDPGAREVALGVGGLSGATRFVLSEPALLNRWLTDYLGYPVLLRHEPEAGFPDDRAAPGPTVVGAASLRAVTGWFPELDEESTRRRFRANLEIGGEDGPAFAEDALFAAPGELRPFSIGHIRLLGHNPCQRCAVPGRDPETGAETPGFTQEFAERRRQTLPAWSNPAQFTHFYRLAVNTSIPASEAGKVIRVGDPVAA